MIVLIHECGQTLREQSSTQDVGVDDSTLKGHESVGISIFLGG